ncbi:MAG: hypothetical protein AB7G44_11980 [Bacteroidia bacterium]
MVKTLLTFAGMKSPCLLLLFIIPFLQASAQEVMQYAPGFEFREGVYLNFEQFKNNNPIPKNSIISKLDKSDTEFLPSILDEKTFSYKDVNDTVQTLSTENVWGFSRNGTVFVRVENDHNRIAVLGSISHFVATITVYYNGMNSPFMNPYYGPGSMPTTTQEMRQMILDYKTGRTMDFTQENMENILQRDQRLFEEFNALKKSQKKDMLFLYLRKYNEKHPLFFPAE